MTFEKNLPLSVARNRRSDSFAGFALTSEDSLTLDPANGARGALMLSLAQSASQKIKCLIRFTNDVSCTSTSKKVDARPVLGKEVERNVSANTCGEWQQLLRSRTGQVPSTKTLHADSYPKVFRRDVVTRLQVSPGELWCT